MNTLDIILLVPIAFGFFRGLIKGAVLEIMSFAGVLLSLFLTRMFMPPVVGFLQDRFAFSSGVAITAAMVTLFFGFLLALHLLALAVDKLISAIALGWLNKLLGAVFGAFKYALVLSLLMHALAFVNGRIALVGDETLQQSVLYNPVKSVAETIIPYCLPERE